MSNYGFLNLDQIGEAIRENPELVRTTKYGREIKLFWDKWEDGNISMTITPQGKPERYKAGKLLNKATNNTIGPIATDDLPF